MASMLRDFQRRINRQRVLSVTAMVLVAGLGTYLLVASHAASPFGSSEAESGTLGGGATTITDNSASNDSAVKFGTGSTMTGGGNCPGLPNGTAAFCDMFNNPTVNSAGSRSGQLNGTVWGVSDSAGIWYQPSELNAVNDGAATLPNCDGGIQDVNPPDEIEICSGNLIEDHNDGEGVDEIAMYPKQPFNFAGRTGKVVFDVSNNSEGNHAAWPEFWMTDQPVPSPFIHEQTLTMLPRNGFAIRLAGCTDGTGAGPCFGSTCPSGVNMVGVDSAAIITNYVSNDSFEGGNIDLAGGSTASGVCESQPGQQNHYEIDVSQNQITVYGTNAFSGTWSPTADPLVELATIQNANLNFTQGLIWLMDVHYNADKCLGPEPSDCANQRNDSFAWSNVGFDGPVETRDLTYDVPDNNIYETNIGGGGNSDMTGYDLQYDVPNGGTSQPLTTESIPSSAIASEKSGKDEAYLLFAFTDTTGPEPYPLDFYINQNNPTCTSDNPWPFPSSFPGEGDTTTNGTNVNSDLTIEEPLNVNCLQSGTNTITFANPSGTDYKVYSIDVLLPGAGGIPNPNTPID
jgi:hypothetical protein